MLAELAGVKYLPASVSVGIGPILNPGTGLHCFDMKEDLLFDIGKACDIVEFHAAPSRVFRSIRDLDVEVGDDALRFGHTATTVLPSPLM